MKRAELTTIVFDLGGVLVDWNPRYLFRKLMSNEAEIESFLRDVCNHDWNEKQDAGRPFSEAVIDLAAKFPNHREMIEAYHQRWEEMLAGSFQETVSILEELHRDGKYRLFGLSNWSAETYPLAERRFPFLKLFSSVLVSGEEKLIKPDPRFFQLLTTRHAVRAEQSVFIDDVKKNIDAAAELGFTTVHLLDPKHLRSQLRELGIHIQV